MDVFLKLKKFHYNYVSQRRMNRRWENVSAARMQCINASDEEMSCSMTILIQNIRVVFSLELCTE